MGPGPPPQALQARRGPTARELVAGKLAQQWSPEQISGWLARTYPGEHALQVSTETIYRSLFVQARGVLRKELTAHLRTRRTMRRSGQATRSGQGRGGIVDAVSIRERPAEASDRAVPATGRGPARRGGQPPHRHPRRAPEPLCAAREGGRQGHHDGGGRPDGAGADLPAKLQASLTWDRGMELADHRRFTVATDVAVYFCDPRSPGSGAPTRTPTACSASTSPSKPISRSTASPTWTRSLLG